jgi:hypothetical protein
MLQRYHVIDLDDLRRAGRKASDYRGPKEVVVPLRSVACDAQSRWRATVSWRAFSSPARSAPTG